MRVINKVARVIAYYLRLICYAAAADPKVFHILWNNRFELFDRTVLTLYYRLLGKRLVLTAHNVNAGKRDGNDCWLNRFSLATQYRLVHHIFVHTDKMKRELALEFKVPGAKATVIPYGINNKVPDTALTSWEAKERLGLKRSDKALLFFGGITPYKGLEYAVRAVAELATSRKDYRLIIAGRPRDDMAYWKSIEKEIAINRLNGQVIVRSEFIPDEDIEVYFKAADVLILPYTYIFQSGVLFLGYSFGLPVIAADVGSLREEIIEGQTGFLFDAENADDLADVIQSYFQSDLFNELDERRQWIRQYANDRYSWAKVAVATKTIYSELVED